MDRHAERSITPVVLALLVAGLPGCTTPDAADAAEQSPPRTETRPEESYGEIVTGPGVGPDLDATTNMAPRLVEGEWWRVRFDTFLLDESVEVVRVVANATRDGYIIGMPHEGWLKEAISFHAPSFGDVGVDYSYEMHGKTFAPLRFPLEEDATWDTFFAGAPVRAQVVQADQFAAKVDFFSTGDPGPLEPLTAVTGEEEGPMMTLVYDARQHAITSMTSFLGTFQVIDHGYDFSGWITVPRGATAEIDYAVIAGDNPPVAGAPRQIAIEDDYNRMTVLYFVFNLDERAVGIYSVADEGPDGTLFEVRYQGPGIYFEFAETTKVQGTWTMEEQLIGPGGVFRMGIAYHQFDIELPSQLRRGDHSHAVTR